MQLTTIGFDLGKNVFQVHGVTADGQVIVRKKLGRAEVLPFFRSLDPCLVGMEACFSAHHWGRELAALGHQVKLMPPSYVKPYVKRGKNDAVDAEAICDAVTQPRMLVCAGEVSRAAKRHSVEPDPLDPGSPTHSAVEHRLRAYA